MRDEESKLHEAERKIREKQMQEKNVSDRLKNEFEDLRARFEQMAYELRFSIEDELRIYARLLDELMKKSTAAVNNAANPSSTSTFTNISSTIRSGGIEDRDAPPSTFGSGGIFDSGHENSRSETRTSSFTRLS